MGSRAITWERREEVSLSVRFPYYEYFRQETTVFPATYIIDALSKYVACSSLVMAATRDFQSVGA